MKQILVKIFSRISSHIEAIHQKLLTKATYWSAFWLGFSILILVLVCAALSGCHTTKTATQVITTTNHDTIYMNRMQYDSIFIDNIHLIDRGKDTIIIQDAKVEYRFRLLKDTVRIHQVDSIPVVKEVEVTKTVTEQYVPWYIKVLAWTGAICLLLIILYVVIKLVFKR